MPTKNEATQIDSIIQRYLRYPNLYHSDDEIISFFRKEAEESQKQGFNDFALFFEGTVFGKEKKYDLSINKFQTALVKSPNFAYPWNGLAKLTLFKSFATIMI